MKTEFIRKGIKIMESCLNNCKTLHFEVNIFKPNQNIMNVMLKKDYLKLHFNGDDPDSGILIFHNSEDKYPHNGDIKFTCYLYQVLEVLERVKKHKKVKALIKKIKKNKEVKRK